MYGYINSLGNSLLSLKSSEVFAFSLPHILRSGKMGAYLLPTLLI